MSIKGLSSGALFAKVKACSTSLLSDEDYMKAASCTSLEEFTAYLKNKTPYIKAFDGIGMSFRVTRQHLEAVIKRMSMLRLEKIVGYAKLADNYVAEYFLMKHETECIISRLRQHGEYTMDSYLMYLPEGFFTETSFDIKALEKATDAAAVLAVLEKTPYAELLRKALEHNENGRWVPENLLYRYLYETGAERFRKKLNKKDFSEVDELLAMLSDMMTVNNIYRIKKYYPQHEEALMLQVFASSLTHFTPKQLDGLKKTANAKEFSDKLSVTKYKGLAALFEAENGALFTKRYISGICRKKFKRSNNAAVSALYYLNLVSTEADNLIMVAEGISSGAEPEKICSMLVK